MLHHPADSTGVGLEGWLVLALLGPGHPALWTQSAHLQNERPHFIGDRAGVKKRNGWKSRQR